ncbi:hypothetical protein, conserved [Eimeria maxima]|uniref:Uncharacterized protein n=1 Tax=Eimeria maxima TaxID=5804 RepID=U6M1F7_EIMMA|nr:hypothetical protein, conserved [Eimeria maxima]CDJ57846.1 hypothetical protein, conserved [Eimeria maxima]
MQQHLHTQRTPGAPLPSQPTGEPPPPEGPVLTSCLRDAILQVLMGPQGHQLLSGASLGPPVGACPAAGAPVGAPVDATATIGPPTGTLNPPHEAAHCSAAGVPLGTCAGGPMGTPSRGVGGPCSGSVEVQDQGTTDGTKAVRGKRIIKKT